MKRNGRVVRVLDGITNAMAFLAGFVIVFVTVLIAASVVSRIAGGDGLPWTLEVTEYSLVYACFLAVPWVLKQDAHVKVDFVVERIRKRSEKAYTTLQRATDLIVAIICGVMTYYGIKVVVSLWERNVIITSILNWPKAPVVAIIPVGFMVALAQLVRINVERERARRVTRTGVAEEGVPK